ncbi:ABC transporter ATP-binding protein [Streptomyces daliensis]|uniref:ABC transporter ATP-binding protein n=1 Tax=Streptomyces daliensis TaxID=299421 RepID=A0A8T4J537_9ACTN|nr:ABC transporter ATP-binding protein [Streptomyces daliensis]
MTTARTNDATAEAPRPGTPPEGHTPEAGGQHSTAAGHGTTPSPGTGPHTTEPGAARPGAVGILRRGIAASPELLRGIRLTLLLALLGGAGRVVVPVLVQQVLDKGLADGKVDMGTVYRLAMIGVVAVAATAVVTRTTQKRLAMASERALCQLRVKAFAHVHRLSVAEQSTQQRGALVSRVSADVEALGIFLQWGGIAWIVNGAIMTATLVTMAVYDWRLTLVVVLIVVPLVLMLRALQRRLGAAHDRVRTDVSGLLTVVSETVQGAGVIRGYGIQRRTTARTFRAIHRWRDSKIRAGLFAALVFTSGEFFGTLTVVGVVAAGIALGPLAGLTAGTLVAFLLLVNLFLEPVTELTEVIDHTQTAVAGWRKVLDLLDTPIEVPAPRDGVVLPRQAHSLEVRELSYAYQEGAEPVLADVSLSVVAGARVAVVGATGAGKTTLAKLLVRLADPTSGRILLGGTDVRDLAPASLRSRVVMVPQDCFLFDSTVAENVRFGKPEATDEEIADAFGYLGLGDWLAALPDGPHTRTGQRGENLSLGERQLVALARAHVADPGLLILDEATSSVDPATDTRLTHALENLSTGRTSLTIAHRLATAERADEILVFAHGRLAERGAHGDLLRRGGVYAGLYASWLDVTAGAPGGVG